MAITDVPNQGVFKTNHGNSNNGSLPLAGNMGDVHGSNARFAHGSNARFAHGDPGGSGPLTREASPVHGSNERFKDGDPGYTPRPASAIEPGKGAVPVNPFMAGAAGIVPTSVLRDSAKR
jgi:hypothetical protein